MNRRRFSSGFLGLLSLTLLFLLTPARPLYAAPVQDDEVLLGDDLTLHEGEQINGDLVLLGGNLTMRAGSSVEGSITAFGGRVEVDGTIAGELVAFGGDVTLRANARVEGDVVALGGRVHRVEGAQTGRIVEGAALARAGFWRDWKWPFFSPGLGFRSWSGIWVTVSTLAGALIIALLGMAVVNFWPTQTAQVRRTILVAPLPSLGVGCLLYPLAGTLIILVLISVCLSPFAPLVGVLLVTAGLFGWIALGTLWGDWLVRRAGWRRATPVAVAGIGIFTLSVALAVVGAVPLLGPLLVLGAASVGLGAVALSRFGSSPYKGRSMTETPEEA